MFPIRTSALWMRQTFAWIRNRMGVLGWTWSQVPSLRSPAQWGAPLPPTLRPQHSRYLFVGGQRGVSVCGALETIFLPVVRRVSRFCATLTNCGGARHGCASGTAELAARLS